MTVSDLDPALGGPGVPGPNYEQILRNIHDGVYTLDPNGVITWVNEVAIEEFDAGYTREELIGAPVTKILSPPDVEQCVELIADLVTDDPHGSRRCEIALQTATGREIPCDLHLALLPAGDGSFEGTLGVVRDIAERKRREQGLSVMNRVLRHNVRNELNIILAQADQLAAAGEPVGAIHDAARRLLRSSEKARDVEAALGRDGAYAEPVDLAAVVAERSATFGRQYPDAQLDVSAPSACWVLANPTLGTVVDNLLENAIVHSDRDRPTVELSVDPGSAAEPQVMLEVADDGPGLPPAEVEALEADHETPLVHGSGVGLWLVTWIVDSLDGEVAFEQRDPRGSAVTVRLPRTTGPEDAD